MFTRQYKDTLYEANEEMLQTPDKDQEKYIHIILLKLMMNIKIINIT